MSKTDVTALLALASIALFVFGLKRLSRVRTARTGNALMAAGMLLAIVLTLIEMGFVDYRWIAVGLVIGSAIGYVTVARAQATEMPEIVARFNGFGGASSALVAISLFWAVVVETPGDGTAAGALGAASAATLVLSVLIGAVTLAGSILAELKLRGTIEGTPRIPARGPLMGVLLLFSLVAGFVAVFSVEDPAVSSLFVLALVLGSVIVSVALVVPIGGADMPVVISLLNSFSGLAAAATGFALNNALLIIAGTIVGASGLILTQIMCVAMNRSLVNVLIGGFSGGAAEHGEYGTVIAADPESTAMVLEAAQSVIIVPGYGLAAARAQNAAYALAQALQRQGAEVRFAIHPVAGRMPGHMNVVLAEAEVPYEMLEEMSEINADFAQTDVVIVVGANDVVNPAARNEPGSPIAGMPILDAGLARRVFIIKRSLSPGYAGIKNPLFEQDNAAMLYGDAKDVLEHLAAELSANA
ncbi:MAG TPA: NAD(P)(+) transhydrogenase (Re/Si-specific) subunit beta [Egicoccus sp.]|nr:NAD(P)(+) transhydrogenase (Re/Si-specific) subunit beta [Egicoccus sp.]HSK24487.1 NAD(P)(+) transhydrogenase (Re/Si-specific) subunit beta [Egicoccus sp.]